MPIAAHQVEQDVVAVAIEYDFAITGGFDGDRHFFGSVGGQVIGAIPGGAATGGIVGVDFVGVIAAIELLINTGVNQDRVAGRTRGADARLQSPPSPAI